VTLDLRDHFDRAVSDDPGAALEDMADAAIAEGGRLRRRRNQRAAIGVAAAVAAGVVVVIGTVAGLNLSPNAPKSAVPPVTLAAAMMPVTAPSCRHDPVDADATDVVIFLAAEVTDVQRSALDTALRDDPRVDAMMFENREEAYQRFRTRFAQYPDFLAAVSAAQLPESFRMRLGAAEQYTEFRLQYATMDGVGQISGRRCTKDAPVGGIL
jgi:cell division transport system permease protein